MESDEILLDSWCNPIILKADTGANKHYLRNVDATILKNVGQTDSSINVH